MTVPFLASILSLFVSLPSRASFVGKATSTGCWRGDASILIEVPSPTDFDDGDDPLVTLKLSGPRDYWYGFAFDATSMVSGGYSIQTTVSKDGIPQVYERYLSSYMPGQDLAPTMVELVSYSLDSVHSNITLTRRRTGISSYFYTFPSAAASAASVETIKLLHAVGRSEKFGYHGTRCRTVLDLVYNVFEESPSGAPAPAAEPAGRSVSCDAFDTASEDTVPPSDAVPPSVMVSKAALDMIDITHGYNYFYNGAGSNDLASWAPGTNKETGAITVTKGVYGSDNAEATKVWNGTLYPDTSAQGLFDIFSSFDHNLNVWHKIGLDIRQGDNELKSRMDCLIAPKIYVFGDDIDLDSWPRGLGDTWNNRDLCRTKGSGCFEFELDLERSTDGVELRQSSFGEDVIIQFPFVAAREWTHMEALFRLKDVTKCVGCFPAIMVENNGWPRWNRNISWSIKNVTIERLSGEVTWETPITTFYSEAVKIPRMDPLATVEAQAWDRTDCPHEQTDLYEWHEASTWNDNAVPSTADDLIRIPEGKSVIIRSCSLDNDEYNYYKRIYVPSTSSLVFDDAEIDIHVGEIWVDGNMFVGSDTCRLYSNINFYFHGSKSDSSLLTEDTFDESGQSSKGIVVNGNIEVHGKKFHPTWTKLAISAYPGDDRIFLQESVNWEVGQQILVVTSIYQDYPDSHQNEVRTIAAIGDSDWTTNNVIYFGNDSNRLVYFHYSGLEYQTEVSLLSRRIKFEGMDYEDPYGFDNYFGGHTRVQLGGTGTFQGVLAYHMGQKNVMARYPFHAHHMQNAGAVSFSETSVWSSFFRCWTVHGSNKVTVERNVAFDVIGHCMYLEDGVEEENVIEYNSVALVHPIGRASHGSCFVGEWVCSGCASGSSWADTGGIYYYFDLDELLVPADVGASAYYISNAYNVIRGNIASGGWAGYSFINMFEPLGTHLGQTCDSEKDCPYNRPTLEFDGNIAHSSGFYWGEGSTTGCGSCIYAGGKMIYDEDEAAYQYFTSRESHDERYLNSSEAWSVFTNVKTYLCDYGTNYWGSRVIIDKLESHDSHRGVFFLGETALTNALINAYSNNEPGAYSLTRERSGFQWYDTSVKTILKNVTFRNFKSGEPVILFSTKEDDGKTPEGNAASSSLTYDNCDEEWLVVDRYCGSDCTEAFGVYSNETQSSRNMAFYDYDGSASRLHRPAIIATQRLWWEMNDDCVYDTTLHLYYCPWYEQNDGAAWTYSSKYHNIAHIDVDVPLLTDSSQKHAVSGYFSQFGRNYSTLYSKFPGVSGWTNMGWYFRPIHGSPQQFEVGPQIQIPRKSFIVLAVRYPANAKFNVWVRLNWYSDRDVNVSETATYEELAETPEDLFDDLDDWDCDDAEWWQPCKDSGGLGPAWHFDGEFFYLRVVNMFHYMKQLRKSPGYWEHEGMRLWSIVNFATFYVNVTSCQECPTSVAGFYDTTDYLPKQFPTHSWDATGYWNDATAPPTNMPV